MFAAAFCAMIFVWMTAISTLQGYYLTLRYFDKAMRLAIKTVKAAVAKENGTFPLDMIPDPYLKMGLSIVAETENEINQLKVRTLEEVYFWFQIVEG